MCLSCETEEERMERWKAIRDDPTIMTDEDIKALLEYLQDTHDNALERRAW